MVDLDLLSCFAKNCQESLEGSGGIKLSRIATMEERESKRVQKVRSPLGKKAPLNRCPEKLAVGLRFAQGR